MPLKRWKDWAYCRGRKTGTSARILGGGVTTASLVDLTQRNLTTGRIADNIERMRLGDSVLRKMPPARALSQAVPYVAAAISGALSARDATTFGRAAKGLYQR